MPKVTRTTFRRCCNHRTPRGITTANHEVLPHLPRQPYTFEQLLHHRALAIILVSRALLLNDDYADAVCWTRTNREVGINSTRSKRILTDERVGSHNFCDESGVSFGSLSPRAIARSHDVDATAI
jgi:hypothetical protein